MTEQLPLHSTEMDKRPVLNMQLNISPLKYT